MLGGGGMMPNNNNQPQQTPQLQTQNTGFDPSKAKEAYNDGYLAGLREAQKIRGEGSRRRLRSSFDDEEDYNPGYAKSTIEPVRRPPISIDNRSAKDRRPKRVKSKKGTNINSTPFLRNDPNQANILNNNGRKGFKDGKVEDIERNEPDQVYDVTNKGGNNRFFDRSKLKEINNFRTKDGKNFDEQVDLRRQRYVRNKKNNFVDGE